MKLLKDIQKKLIDLLKDIKKINSLSKFNKYHINYDKKSNIYYLKWLKILYITKSNNLNNLKTSIDSRNLSTANWDRGIDISYLKIICNASLIIIIDNVKIFKDIKVVDSQAT